MSAKTAIRMDDDWSIIVETVPSLVKTASMISSFYKLDLISSRDVLVLAKCITYFVRSDLTSSARGLSFKSGC